MFKRRRADNLFSCALLVAMLVLITPRAAAVDFAVRVAGNGDVGIGTASPVAPLHIARDAGASIGDDVGFRMENLTTGSNWVFTAVEGNTDHFIINKIGSGKQELRLNEGGNMSIPGTLTTGGPSCGGGCDEVFAQKVETIDEHAKKMWQQHYLPGVGPTTPGGPMNVSEKMGGLLNELEKAHIYIDRLNGKLKEKDHQYSQLRQEKDEQIAELSERMERLEALLLDTGGEE